MISLGTQAVRLPVQPQHEPSNLATHSPPPNLLSQGPPTSRVEPTCSKAIAVRLYLVYETKGCLKSFYSDIRSGFTGCTGTLQRNPSVLCSDTADTSVFTDNSMLTPQVYIAHTYTTETNTLHISTHTPQAHTGYVPLHTHCGAGPTIEPTYPHLQTLC